MNIFEVLIAPFIFIIEQLFLLSYNLTGNYGASIILLSLGISLLLLPIFIIIEKAKKKDDALKLKMKPLINEIKRCYKGQERYYYLNTLNRQFHYKPIKALVPILSLLLQIPFFIAAYKFLEFYQPLVGVSFLFINDLGLPDGLMGHLNILPIAMTLVNLLSAYFYTKNGNTDERKQMLIVAIIFLILLFKLPAGLVLYWTMNNIFSFFRLFITNPEVFKTRNNDSFSLSLFFNKTKTSLISIAPKLRKTFILSSIAIIIIELNALMQHQFEPQFKALINIITLPTALTLLIALLVLIHKSEPLNVNEKFRALIKKNWPYFKPTFYTLLTLTSASQINWALQYKFDTIIQRLALSAIASVVLTLLIALLVLLYSGKLQVFTNKFNFRIKFLRPSYIRAFKLILALSILVQIYLAIIGNYSNIVLKVGLITIFCWLLIISIANINSALNRLQIKTLTDALARFKIQPKIFISIIFLSIYFFFASSFYYSGPNATLKTFAFVMLIIAQAIGFIYYIGTQKKSITPGSIIVFGLILLIQLGIELAKTFGTPLLIFTTVSLQNILLFGLGILFISITLPNYFRFTNFTLNEADKSMNALFILSLFYILGLAFFWSPLMVYASFPEAFSFPAVQVLVRNLTNFLISFSAILFVFYVMPRKIKFIFINLGLTISFLFFINSFIIPVDVGSLQLGQYVEASNLSMKVFYYILEGLFLVALYIGVKNLLQKKYLNQLKLVIALLSIVLIIQSLLTSSADGEFLSKHDNSLDLPSNISFSKDKDNIIYIIPDTFMGINMKAILEDEPELKAVYEGFTWYPNTLSVSTNTCPSISSLLAGANYNVDKLNEDRRHTMAEKITKASENLYTKIKMHGYNLTSTQMVYSHIDKNKYDAYLPYWHSDWNKWNDELKIGGAQELDFRILWKNAFFYGAPLFIKPQIYKKGKWIKIEKETNKNTKLSQPCNLIRLLPYISDTLNTHKSFIYIHSLATHGPWYIVNDNGKLISDVSGYDNQKWFLQKFALWINWMKDNGVYDNTKIVMLSDHSHYLPNEAYAEFGGDLKWGEKGQEKLSSAYFWRVNALLMVKDFGAKGELKEDWRFLSNSDAPAITFNENSPLNTDSTISRTLPVFFVDYWPRISQQKHIKITKQFEVSNYIYDPENWTEIK